MDPNLDTQEPQPQPYPTRPQNGQHADDLMPPDPLLRSDAYIEVDMEATPLRSRVVVDPPEMSADTVTDQAADSSQRRARRKMLPEDAAERPAWLPENWKMELRVRNSGATAGSIDRYYIDPVSGKKFRSSKEVLHYLETGTKRKPSDSPGGSQKQKKSSPMPKKAPPFYFDFENPPQSVSWVQTNAPGDAWTPYSCHGMVPECIRNEWSTVFSSVTQVVGQKNAPLKDKKSSS
ncbi:methyl-CpG-binding domain-containing protein 5-like [Ipomoea triloba]|uniref:methyl-CpG-binding domain-containing protein 5-like n=1 Tax=Ipomoea triloba TaxID=35885 RepID=UPI00125E832F|nr:methyl-CpG-binding domain-containing protein 5-like [Ipomoea triloba]GMD12666.1 methyl-CpG-binding domain-containing protein 5-like [Ipomoea batatas]GMD14421.1 methyl-CpG-binding domain-containing protein 5-like [Ipomoea batatas]